MCGIAGYFGTRDAGPEVLRRMTSALAHRGPDADGFYESGPVRLGHRRLAVIDLETGRQPLFNEDGTVGLVFNGEIYNFQTLRDELIACGHRFSTRTDSEVLVHGWEQWGERLLGRLRGMFAFALWDGRAQTLFLARDHLGVKPLYYAAEPGLFVFASEPKALVQHPGVRRDLDPDALALYLEGQFIPTPYSIWKGIRKLPPGHAVIVTERGTTLTRWWLLDYQAKLDLAQTDAVDYVEKALRESVQGMLVSDVPLGAFISGGVDSSLVAALVAQTASHAVETFNLGFSGDGKGSEHEWARRVADHIGSRHHTLMLKPHDVLGMFDRWLGIFDEPFADQAALPTMALAEFARRRVTVALTGEGADEVFGGYDNYLKRVRGERVSGLLGARASPLPALIRRLPARWRKDRLLKAIASPRARRYVTIPNVFDETLRDTLYSDAFLATTQAKLADRAEAFFDECNADSYLERIQYVDTRLWLPDDLLTKVDRATMAFSLEARVPYLDHIFVEACARIPAELKCRGNQTKYLLKKVAERFLPRDVVYRPKQGFFMPMSEWLAGELQPLVRDALGDSGLARRRLFRPGVLDRLLLDHYRNRRNHAMRLWTLLVLEQWFRRAMPDFSF